MIEREVTDLLVITLSIFGVSLIIYSPSYSFSEDNLFIIGLSIMAITTFLHIVFTQLEMMNTRLSKGFSVFNSLLYLTALIGYFTTDHPQWDGFWNVINVNYSLLFGLLFTALLISILFSFVAKPLVLDESQPKQHINSSDQ